MPRASEAQVPVPPTATACQGDRSQGAVSKTPDLSEPEALEAICQNTVVFRDSVKTVGVMGQSAMRHRHMCLQSGAAIAPHRVKVGVAMAANRTPGYCRWESFADRPVVAVTDEECT